MKDLVLGLVFLALGVTVWLMAREFPVVPGMAYGADFFPSLIAIGMVLGGAALSVTSMIKLRSQARENGAPMALPSPAVLMPVVMVIAYIYLSETIGAALCMTAIMLIMLITSGVRWIHSVWISVASAAVISLSFGHVLKVPLPIGPLGF